MEKINFNDLITAEYNGMVASIDYLEFTVWDYDPRGVIESILELDFLDFEEQSHGSYGYPHMLKAVYGDIRVLYGAPNADVMGVHVTVPGAGCKVLFDRILPSSLFVNLLENDCKISRIDFALDNVGDIYFYPHEIVDYVKNGMTKSKWHSCLPYQPIDTAEGKLLGDTVYLGSMKSEMFCRIYDKKMERQNNVSKDIDIPADWVRWELVLRNDRAMAAVEQLIADDYQLGRLMAGILRNYFNILEPNGDSNKSRWPLNEKWQQFLGDIEPIRLYRVVKDKEFTDIIYWVEKQVMPSLAALVEVQGMEWLEKQIGLNRYRISKQNRLLIDSVLQKRRSDCYAAD